MSIKTLPDGYGTYERIDLKTNRKQATIVNTSALVLAIIVVMIGLRILPFSVWRDSLENLSGFYLRLIIFMVGMIGYFVLHELVHGIFISIFGKVRARYGVTGAYAYAGTDKAYFKKGQYTIIALAPVVLWGLVLVLLQNLVSATWFWVIYAIQVCNIAGAAGDFFVVFKVLRAPKGTLVQDTGTSMTFFAEGYDLVVEEAEEVVTEPVDEEDDEEYEEFDEEVEED